MIVSKTILVGLLNGNASVGKLPLQHLNYLTIGTITVGTPPQSFNVEVDAFYENELMVIDVNANLSSVSKTLPEKSTYNAEKSSTYVAVNGNVSGWGINGHKAQDVLNIDSVSGTVKSFLVADKVPYFINYYPVDGLLGLSASKKSYFNVSVVADDLVGQLDKPLISVYVNATIAGNGTGQVTLGAEDSDNCQSTWSYVPSLKYFASSPFTVHASSAEVTIGGQLTTVNLDANVTFMSWPALDVSYAAKDVFVNGTGAKYNESVGYYTIDCDTTKAPLITINIGGVGNSTDSTSQKLVLSGADYIRSWKSMGVCYLGVNFYRGTGMWYLGSQVLNNHCISFNYKDRTVGFADSKTPKTDVTSY
ncbi:eukaryotic aspartyl protease domain-containing protein [Ditylenchus destructor]|nr:eukaryotic aspartyl protease domain-containing protein [Ditylenchus destructor]